MSKKYDLAVRVGSYVDSQGNDKSKYENIGVVLEKEGRPYILLKKTFNPAGVPDINNRESIIVSMFEPKEKLAKTQEGWDE